MILICTAMVAVWLRVAYMSASLEDDVESRIMSFCGTIVKSGSPLELALVRWLAGGMQPVTPLTYHRPSENNGTSMRMLGATSGLIA